MTSRHKFLLIFIGQLFLCAGLSPADATTDTCWSSDDDNEGNCRIIATLFYGGDGGVPMDISCNKSSVAQAPEAGNNDWQRAFVTGRFEKVTKVTLNGCHTTFKTAPTSYGLELLPNCERINQVTIERFHMDTMKPLRCHRLDTGEVPVTSASSTEILTFRNNEIATIDSNSLSIQMQGLRELYLQENSLRHIERNAFDVLRVVEVLHIENEPMLAIKRDTADLFERCAVSSLRLIALKRIAISLFFHLPATLRVVHVERTAIEDDVINITNPQVLQNVTVNNCNLSAFHLADPYSTVVSLNVSHNALASFVVKCDAECAVELLDLSYNGLKAVAAEWFVELGRLHEVYLRGNELKTLSLNHLVAVGLSAQFVDLRDNQLAFFVDSSEEQQDEFSNTVQHLRLRIDGNPWDCVWLLNFAHAWPERFRLFQYEKFISKINVNGLECRPPVAPVVVVVAEEEQETKYLNEHTEMKHDGQQQEDDDAAKNVTPLTLMYPNPQDFKRSQRSEALIIVFMLPLGIAFLFLLLYMWIYCQKVFHLSYYRSFPFRHGHVNTPTSADRFDVVRHLPPTTANNEGYEMPLNGVLSNCNCNNGGTTCSLNSTGCTKSHHITYEAIPAESPYKIYQEILEEEGDATYRSDANTPETPLDANREEHQFYDHLSYME